MSQQYMGLKSQQGTCSMVELDIFSPVGSLEITLLTL